MLFEAALRIFVLSHRCLSNPSYLSGSPTEVPLSAFLKQRLIAQSLWPRPPVDPPLALCFHVGYADGGIGFPNNGQNLTSTGELLLIAPFPPEFNIEYADGGVRFPNNGQNLTSTGELLLIVPFPPELTSTGELL